MKHKSQTVPLAYVRTLLGAAQQHGYDSAAILARLRLPQSLLSKQSDPQQQVPSNYYNAVYTEVMSTLQDESVGVGMKLPNPAGGFRMMCLFVIHCQTLEQAVLRATEFQSFCRSLQGGAPLPANPLLPLDDDRVLYFFPDSSEFAAQGTELAWYAIAHTLAVWRRFCSWLIGTQLQIHEVHIQLPEPAAHVALQRIFECPIHFNQSENGFVFDACHLQARLRHDEVSLNRFLRAAPYHLLANTEIESDDGLLAQMRRIVGPDLSHDFPSVVEMAEHMNVSVRTLRRRLKDLGTTYQTFKDSTRCAAAKLLLGRPELKVNSVAAMLGFDEPSAFHRSFKKWTGSTPGEYRESIRV